MSAPKISRALASRPAFWGKWGIYNPNVAKEYLRQAYNRGYGQPLISGRENGYEATNFITYLARRWNYDWFKVIAMRIDSERTPLMVLRRQIWMARLEYWLRRFHARKAINRAAKVEWAYIKERLHQPMTWTGRDAQHFSLWLLNVIGFWCIGEAASRQKLTGYPVATPEWTPAKPKFAPGFWHLYDPFEDYPFDNQPNYITKQFQRSTWWHNSKETYWAPHRIPVAFASG
mmetsp:Transcript_43270/g.69369  ORF Transcript_43270/g.69369 Transcript_43270/m.69369 type:complete len:231 (+) Transcript_43270:117-809(+)|eukprot:CAMPEP_0197075602 /NCGR_PEP_ID=MMETSP1384-20130603/211696_1 /TAXON_ID=29189 /ORGANISM="Ammonia sp." /LENGTH=230 /DNA_ID=CAMNT_0042514451 /DNA_START=845 /DNA_END=1537 /DNA_ORIENTATION=-